jgi:uncharacterized protein (DUF1330 family)
MAAYLIAICRGVSNRARLEQYWEHARVTFEGYGAKLLAAYTPLKRLEAKEPVEGVVMIEFPSMDMATRWYESPRYQEVRNYRLGASDFEIVIVEGGVVEGKDRMPRIS